MSDINEKDLLNYQLFWVDDKQLKHTIIKFKADNDEDALLKCDEYNIMNAGDHLYYYGKIHYVKCLNKDGTFTIRDMSDRSEVHGLIFHKNAFLRIFESVCDFFSYWMWQKPIDWWYSIKDIVYLLKHKESRSNQWNLDMHLIDTIILNVPSLIKNSHGLMFLDEAIKRLNKDNAEFDLKKYHAEHCSGYPDEVEDLAYRIQIEEYNNLLLNARLYKYYSDAGIIDVDNEDEVEFDKKWRHTLPVKTGTYDEFDYDKLNELHQTAWNNVWDWIKKYGHTLYD